MKLENDWLNPLSGWSIDPEEVANAITHGLGFLLSVVGAIAMGIVVLREGDTWRLVGCMIFAPSLVAVYAMSTLSHSCSTPSRKRFFQILDQAFIYVLITATYTPFSLVFLRTSRWWWLFLAVMWTITIFGFLSKILLKHRIQGVSVWIYVALGWMPILATPSMVGLVPMAGLCWMLIGGLCYTVGTVFLIFDNRVRHFHALWHLFVIAGSVCHFFVILFLVAPVR